MKEIQDKKPWLKHLVLLLGVLTLFLVWVIASAILKGQGNSVLPYPWETIGDLFVLLFGESGGRNWLGILYSVLRILGGFLISFLLGAVLGTIAGLFPLGKSYFLPGISFLRVVPTAAAVIVFITVFYGPQNRVYLDFVPVILTSMITLPLFYEAFLKGIENEDKIILDALRIDGGQRRIQTLFSVIYPDSWGYISMAIAQSFGLGMKVTIMSEALTANSATAGRGGIGSLMMIAQQNGEVENVIAYAFLALLIMGLFDLPLFLLKTKTQAR